MARKLKTGSSRLKTARTPENVERVTNDSIRRSVRASAVRAVFAPPLQVLHFVLDPPTLVHLYFNYTELNFLFFSQ